MSTSMGAYQPRFQDQGLLKAPPSEFKDDNSSYCHVGGARLHARSSKVMRVLISGSGVLLV